MKISSTVSKLGTPFRLLDVMKHDRSHKLLSMWKKLLSSLFLSASGPEPVSRNSSANEDQEDLSEMTSEEVDDYIHSKSCLEPKSLDYEPVLGVCVCVCGDVGVWVYVFFVWFVWFELHSSRSMSWDTT